MKTNRLVLFLLLLSCLLLISCGGEESPTTVTSPTPTPPSTKIFPSVIDNIIVFGNTKMVGDVWEITINSIRTIKPSKFITPKEGNKFIVINLTAKNVTSTEATFSSVLGFTVKLEDGTKAKWSFHPAAAQIPDGSVEAGGKIKGDMVFEIPNNEQQLIIVYKDVLHLYQDYSATWTLAVPN